MKTINLSALKNVSNNVLENNSPINDTKIEKTIEKEDTIKTNTLEKKSEESPKKSPLIKIGSLWVEIKEKPKNDSDNLSSEKLEKETIDEKNDIDIIDDKKTIIEAKISLKEEEQNDIIIQEDKKSDLISIDKKDENIIKPENNNSQEEKINTENNLDTSKQESQELFPNYESDYAKQFLNNKSNKNDKTKNKNIKKIYISTITLWAVLIWFFWINGYIKSNVLENKNNSWNIEMSSWNLSEQQAKEIFIKEELKKNPHKSRLEILREFYLKKDNYFN